MKGQKMSVVVYGKKDSDFVALQFALEARQRKESPYGRNDLHLVLITEQRQVVATDGKRLHVVDNLDTELPVPGLYNPTVHTRTRILLESADKEAVFPENWRDVIPEHKQFWGDVRDANHILALLGSKQIVVDLEYLRALKPYLENSGDCKVYFGEPTRPIVVDFEHDAGYHMRSVIMPRLVDEWPEEQTVS